MAFPIPLRTACYRDGMLVRVEIFADIFQITRQTMEVFLTVRAV